MVSKKYTEYLSYIAYRNAENIRDSIRLNIKSDIVIPDTYEQWKITQAEIKSLTSKNKRPMSFKEWSGL